MSNGGDGEVVFGIRYDTSKLAADGSRVKAQVKSQVDAAVAELERLKNVAAGGGGGKGTPTIQIDNRPALKALKEVEREADRVQTKLSRASNAIPTQTPALTQVLGRSPITNIPSTGQGGELPLRDEPIGIRRPDPQRSLVDQVDRQVRAGMLRQLKAEADQQILSKYVQHTATEGTENLDREQRNRFANTINQKASGDRGMNPLDRAVSSNSMKVLDEWRRGLAQALKIVVSIEAAFNGVKAATDVANIAMKAFNGDTEGAWKASEKLLETIKGIPVVGHRIVAVGEEISNALTGNKDYADAIAQSTKLAEASAKAHKEAVEQTNKSLRDQKAAIDEVIRAQQTATMRGQRAELGNLANTEANERARIDNQTQDRVKETQDKFGEGIDLARQERDRARQRVDALSKPGLVESMGGATGNAMRIRRMDDLGVAQKQLDEASANLEKKEKARNDAVGKIQEQGQKEQQERHRLHERERAKIIDDGIRSELQKWHDASSDVAAAQAEMNAAQLRMQKRGLDARLVQIDEALRKETEQINKAAQEELRENPQNAKAIEERRRQRLGAAGTRSEASKAEARHEEERRIQEDTIGTDAAIRARAFRAAGQTQRAEDEERRARAQERIRNAQSGPERENAKREAEAEEKVVAEERARVRKQNQFDVQQSRLRRTGQGMLADSRDISMRAKEEIEAAAGDESMQQSILDKAKEELLASQNRRVAPEVMSASQAFNTDLRGPSPVDKELNDINKKQLKWLEDIAKGVTKMAGGNNGAVAV